MIEQRRRRMFHAFVIFGSLCACLAVPGHALSADEDRTLVAALHRGIAGSYYFQAKVESPFEFPFQGVLTLTRDGLVVGDTAHRNVPGSPGTDFSTNLGAWTLVDASTRQARIRFLAFESSGGIPLFTHRATLLVGFDRTFREFQGTFTVEALLPEQDPLDPMESGFIATGRIGGRRLVP